MSTGLRNFEADDRKSLSCLGEFVGRTMDIKGDSGMGLERRRTINLHL